MYSFVFINRKQFGRPLAANQLIQKKMADMLTEVNGYYSFLNRFKPEFGATNSPLSLSLDLSLSHRYPLVSKPACKWDD